MLDRRLTHTCGYWKNAATLDEAQEAKLDLVCRKIGLKTSDRFYRMWKYYLMASVGTFRSRKNQLWQIVLSKHGIPGGYQSIR